MIILCSAQVECTITDKLQWTKGRGEVGTAGAVTEKKTGEKLSKEPRGGLRERKGERFRVYRNDTINKNIYSRWKLIKTTERRTQPSNHQTRHN